MKTVTYEQFLEFKPCWLNDENGRLRLKRYAKKQENWSALGILKLNRVSAKDRLWAVLREELINAPILHEFACRCAERAFSYVENHDPRIVAAVSAKRAWVKGEITDAELAAARGAAMDAARGAAMGAAMDAASAAARDAASAAARGTAMGAASAAASAAARGAASAAAWGAAWAARGAAMGAEHKWQVEELIKMLEEQ